MICADGFWFENLRLFPRCLVLLLQSMRFEPRERYQEVAAAVVFSTRLISHQRHR